MVLFRPAQVWKGKSQPMSQLILPLVANLLEVAAMKRLWMLFPALLLAHCADSDEQSIHPEYARQHPEALLLKSEEPVNQTAYSQGLARGWSDVQSRMSEDHRRYIHLYTPATERAFRDGYAAGYHQYENGQFHPMLGRQWNGTGAR
jgi:hypothetical protein